LWEKSLLAAAANGAATIIGNSRQNLGNLGCWGVGGGFEWVGALMLKRHFVRSSLIEGSANRASALGDRLLCVPLFATGLGALGLLGWRRKRKAAALAA
jgi:hypothetical protein